MFITTESSRVQLQVECNFRILEREARTVNARIDSYKGRERLANILCVSTMSSENTGKHLLSHLGTKGTSGH